MPSCADDEGSADGGSVVVCAGGGEAGGCSTAADVCGGGGAACVGVGSPAFGGVPGFLAVAPGVVVLPLLGPEGKVVLIEHYRHATRAW
ncbi:hypothetical protein ACLMNJ_36925, partial [Streptomyces seoulensis]